MLEPTKVRNEMKALQTHFRDKRDYVLGRLTDMGFELDYTPDSTFYIWLNLGALPESINDGLNFFQACLKEKVIVVPGIFFDLNPSKRRDLFDSPCHHFIRVSYGPKVCLCREHTKDPLSFHFYGISHTDHMITARDSQGRHGRFRESSEEVQRFPRQEVGSVRLMMETAKWSQRLQTDREQDSHDECTCSLEQFNFSRPNPPLMLRKIMMTISETWPLRH
jgi:hypothetical protein